MQMYEDLYVAQKGLRYVNLSALHLYVAGN